MATDTDNQDDPFAMFKVRPHVCDVLDIKVLEGRNISKGTFGDFLDTPDPYVVINIPKASEPSQQTPSIDNDVDPHWFKLLRFYLPSNPTEETIAQISLWDSNSVYPDECLGTVEFNLNNLVIDEQVIKTFKFNKTSKVDIEFTRKVNTEYDLRYSLALSMDEKKFRKERLRTAMMKTKELLKERGPMNIRETPCIGLMGSGGGYRASIGFAGAISALKEIGVFDCATYTVGLSGSTWFMSSLYSHPSFPDNGVDYAIKDMRKHLKKNLYNLLRPISLMRYIQRIKEKKKSGQPVTLTDLFGMVIGDHLLGPERTETARLSDFAEKIKEGKAPMPLMTCLHVQPEVSAMVYHEWMEFSPYEIGMAKYGTFVRTKDFNNKFFEGVIAKVERHEEAPLHFLMGVWGSAFSILFHRLTDRRSSSEECCNGEHETNKTLERRMTMLRKRKLTDLDEEEENGEVEDLSEDDDEDNILSEEEDEEEEDEQKEEEKEEEEEDEEEEKSDKHGFSLKNYIFKSLMKSRGFCRREYRAGRILNFMRGLDITCTYPLSPFNENSNEYGVQDDTFSRLSDKISSEHKKVCIVDAGLAFNSPYPVLLRPQRFVDLIISFDFSAREKDDMDPFGELVLAEKWARIHNIPFPKIDTDVYKREGLKELYIFKDEDNPKAPIILHFCLCNVQYRKYSAPDVAREKGDSSGNFNIFDEDSPFSTFEFQYEHENFDKLHDLVKFNTLINKDKIIEAIGDCVRLRKNHKIRYMVSMDEVRRSHSIDEEKKRLWAERFIRNFRSCGK